MKDSSKELRINIGFLLNQTIGYSREFHFSIPELSISSDVILHNFQGVARINRTPQGLLVNGSFSGGIQLDCVRCLEPFDEALNATFDELYAFNERTVTESGLILPEDGYINLYPLVCEYLLLEIPISPICKPDCQGLCPLCGVNWNNHPCEHKAGKGGGEME